MTDYGRLLFSFPDPRAPQRALFILGLALLAAGGLLLLIFSLEGVPVARDDAFGLAVMLALCLLGGAAFAFLGLRDLLLSPEWHLTETHAYRTRGARIIKELVLRDQPTAKMTRNIRYGQVLSVRVDLGRAAIVAPSMDVAQAIVKAWQEAREL